MKRSNNPKKFLSDDELYRVTTKIAAAESMTSAEIKLVIVKHCLTSIKRKALKIFKKYKLDKTGQRNCVLVLVVTTNRQFLIYGDQGIHEKVGQDFWQEVEKSIAMKFRENKMGDGLSAGIHLIGTKLAQYFPFQFDDIDEISNDVVFAN
jgi:uncharacterized membrane protein